MAKLHSALVASAAVIGLAACAPESMLQRSEARQEAALARTNLVLLLDATGTPQMAVPESEVRGLPQGSPFVVNRAGQIMTLTVGPRQAEGVTAGRARVVGNDPLGNPVVIREGDAQGDMAPAGIPVVVGAAADGRPIIRFMTPAEAAAFQRPRAGGPPRGQRTPTALPSPTTGR